jgi:hypothetical protein
MAFLEGKSNRPKAIVSMPAYDVAKTLKIKYEAIPHQTIDRIILIDDASTGKTRETAREPYLTIFVHKRNFGYWFLIAASPRGIRVPLPTHDEIPSRGCSQIREL